MIAFTGPSRLPVYENALPLASWKLRLTAIGIEVLAEYVDWAELNGMDRWLGGVHLTRENIWYWDEEQTSIRRHRSG